MKEVTDISNIVIGKTFSDDHILCIPLTFCDQDGEKRKLTLWWAGDEGYAAAEYAHESSTAKTVLLELINNQLESDDEDCWFP